ncbi:MAG: glycosyltransferase, partial [Steroidobacteraceae bacterium]
MNWPEQGVLSVVVPVCNEAENVAPLAGEVDAALRPLGAYELIFVDDGSTDETAARVQSLRPGLPAVRLLRHDRRCGQSR